MKESFVLGVDIGTYSSKGVLVTIDGSVVASHVVEHGMSQPKPGWFEHDADEVWWHDFVEITQHIIEKSGVKPEHIRGVGTSAIGSCVLPIDASGKPLRPGILYGIDTRAMEEVAYLNDLIRSNAQFSHINPHLSSQASGPKILWIRNHEPKIYKQTRWFLTSQAYLVYKLTAKATIDIYTAGGYTPMFDPKKLAYVKEMEPYVTEVERLPDFYWSHEVVGYVSDEASRETGLAVGTPVIAGTTDAASEALSVGVSDVGDMMMMFGSSIFFIMKTSALTPTEQFWSSNFLDKGSYAFLGGMSTSGSLTRWFRDQFGQAELAAEEKGTDNAYALLAKLATESPAGSKGLVALPYFEGERTPIHDPLAKGVLFGLSIKHTRADVYRAILESVAFGIRHNIDLMNEVGVKAKRILAVGGGTKNLPWMQMVSDIADISMIIPEQQIGASYGDAFMAAVGIGEYRGLDQVKQWIKIKKEITPNPSAKKDYDLNYQIYRELYKQTAPLMHKLSNAQREKP